jgi:transposase-like protein
MRNLLARAPKRAEGLVATMVRTIYQQPSAGEVHAQHARVVEQLLNGPTEERTVPSVTAVVDVT